MGNGCVQMETGLQAINDACIAQWDDGRMEVTPRPARLSRGVGDCVMQRYQLTSVETAYASFPFQQHFSGMKTNSQDQAIELL